MDGDADSHAGGSIPELPEDIWRYIHSLLPMRDAARAACLSRFFLRSWRRHPVLKFSKSRLGLKANARPDGFVGRINHILSNHSGIGIKIFKLRVPGYWDDDACPYLDTWLHFAVKSGIEELTLELCQRCRKNYIVPCSLLSDGVRNSIRYLRLAYCAFHPTAAELGLLRSLTSLSLFIVSISGEELDCFLSKSPALEQLELNECNEISFLKIPCTLQRLNFLKISHCSSLRVIESKAPNLATFIYSGSHAENLSLGETLKMKNFNCMRRSDLVCDARTELPALMPNLESLDICSGSERVDTPMLPTKFMFLKDLRICLFSWGGFSPSYDYFSLASFIDAAPSLEVFSLAVPQLEMKHESVFGRSSQLRPMPDHRRHARLKTVKITGFSSAKGLVELTCYILKTAAESLECLTLDTLFGANNRCNLQDPLAAGRCDFMIVDILREAPRAVAAIRTYIEDKVPASVNLTVLGPCSRCHARWMV